MFNYHDANIIIKFAKLVINMFSLNIKYNLISL